MHSKDSIHFDCSGTGQDRGASLKKKLLLIMGRHSSNNWLIYRSRLCNFCSM